MLSKYLFIPVLVLGITCCHEPEPNKEKSPPHLPSMSTVTGTIEVMTFRGPPNYGEDTVTDNKETVPVLLPDAPVNLSADEDDEPDPTKKGITGIQLITKSDLAKIPGIRVRVRGVLFRAQTGHHFTEILMDVKEIEQLGDPNEKP